MTATIPATSARYDGTRILERPDGFYWQATEGGREYGPFPTLLEAVDDMEAGDTGLEVGTSLREAEDEIGIADWIDPDTGQPAEDFVAHIDDL
jgi:hypothetical protein